MMFFLRIFACFFLFLSTSASAVDVFNLNNSPLPMAQAYHFSATRHDNVIVAHWEMAKGYYLYQSHLCFIKVSI